MLRTWKKIKKSGHYHRKLEKERQAIVRRALEIDRSKLMNKKKIVNSTELRFPGSPIINNSPADSCSASMEVECGNYNSESFVTADGSSDEGSDDDIDKNHSLLSNLRKWVTKYNIRHDALKELMKIINARFDDEILPADPRTLMQTPTTINIIPIGENEEYWHYGLENSLKMIFHQLSEPITISLNINIDGLPLSKSSKAEFWPILFNIAEFPQIPPMVIGIFHGKAKCHDLESLLSRFVEEMNKIMSQGVCVNSHKIHVLLRCFICDSPARAYVKGTAYFNNQNGCQKCTTTGEYSHESRTNIFPRTECEPRTDELFRKKMYGSHHQANSPLLKLRIDMINQFPVGDSLHLLHLGIMKRLLFGWRDGTFSTADTKWPARTTKEVSSYLMECKMPAEFHRAVRGLDCLSHWKGTEYRTLLHYVGIVALKDHLTEEAYQHFLLLFCSVLICSSKLYFHMLPVARMMLLQYIEVFAEIYGEDYITSNVHNLSHLVDDVERFGELDSFSAYPFENLLGKIKRLLRSGNRPLAQVAKRLLEDGHCLLPYECVSFKRKNRKLILTKKNCGENVDQGLISELLKSSNEELAFFSKVQFTEFCLSTDAVNCWFLTTHGEIARVVNIVEVKDKFSKLCCCASNEKNNFFSIPIQSRHFDIYSTSRELFLNECNQKLFDFNEIRCKLVRLCHHNNYVFIPLIHSKMRPK